MASTTNPFVAGLQSFAADPEAEAKGRYIQANTAKTQNEADILADRKKWRALFGQANDLNPTVRAGELSNDKIDVTGAYKGNAAAGGAKMLFDTDTNGNLVPKTDMYGRQVPIDPKTFSLASLLMGHAPSEVTSRALGSGGFDKPLAAPKTDYKLHEFSDTNTGIHYRQLANADGSPRFKENGEPEMAALNPNTVKTTMPSAAGGQVLQTSQSAGGAPVTTALNLPGSRLIDSTKLSQIARLAHANDAAARGLAPEGMNDLEFVVAKRIGHIGPDGKVNVGVPMLNPDEVESIKSLTDTIMASDATIPLSMAVSAAIDHHQDIAQGKIVTKDYDNRGFWDNFGGNNNGAADEKDAAGVELPQYGGKREYSTSQGYKRTLGEVLPVTASRGKYSDLPDDTKVVPLSVRLAGDAVDETGVAQIMANNTGKPVFSKTLPADLSTVKNGEFYHKDGKFYVAEMQESGKVVPRLITNIKK